MEEATRIWKRPPAHGEATRTWTELILQGVAQAMGQPHYLVLEAIRTVLQDYATPAESCPYQRSNEERQS